MCPINQRHRPGVCGQLPDKRGVVLFDEPIQKRLLGALTCMA